MRNCYSYRRVHLKVNANHAERVLLVQWQEEETLLRRPSHTKGEARASTMKGMKGMKGMKKIQHSQSGAVTYLQVLH
ncbi:hypothetical protein KAR02_05570, partial [Candidatus Bipolaricaulota bacterium]|nr:hypothetical protein [Candidatus Bipolaricaulota bacterium]